MRGVISLANVLFALSIAATSLVGCDPADGPPDPGKSEAALQPLASCGEAEAALREAAINEMNRRLDEARDSTLTGGSGCYYGVEDFDTVGAMAGVPSSAPSPTLERTTNTDASQVSTTNNQVAGVDEADFIKNDHEHIYLVSGHTFRIIDAWPPESARQIAEVEVSGTARKLFVYNDRALIYSSVPHEATTYSAEDFGSSAMPAWRYGGGSAECTYGYSCSFTGDGNATDITVLDISNRYHPKVVREVHLSGSYVNARRVGSAVYTVLSSPGVRFPNLRYYPEDWPTCVEHSPIVVELAYERLRAENERIIRETPIEDWLPSITDTVKTDAREVTRVDLLGSCEGFYRSRVADGQQLTTLLALRIDDEEPAQTSTIVSRPGAVYAAAEGLYVAVPHERYDRYGWYPSMDDYQQVSTVHKFALEPEHATAHYAASGVVKGKVLNQFAMDELDGYLRIATTSGHVPDPDVRSTLTVLEPEGGALKRVGRIDDLAPGEDIRSVRFDKQRAFIVTFKKTDPLFVIDLSVPTDPEVLAELKIPGFSTYMQMMDENHLLSIGYDADDQGSFAWFQGVLLQIFDVSDPQNPQRIHREVIGTRGSSSEALTNHLAFNYFAPMDLLAIPMTICEDSAGGGSYGTEMTFSGLLVYDVTTDDGFALRGGVPHEPSAGITCYNWWTDASSQVRRSIFMDDYVVSISDTRLKINRLDALTEDVADIPLD